MRTNATVTFKTKSTDWQGKETETSLGSYSVWVERHTVSGYLFAGQKDTGVISRGVVFLYSDLSITENDIVMVDSVDRAIVGIDKYTDGRGAFHHAEVTYR